VVVDTEKWQQQLPQQHRNNTARQRERLREQLEPSPSNSKTASAVDITTEQLRPHFLQRRFCQRFGIHHVAG
jgi:hypothetical protein